MDALALKIHSLRQLKLPGSWKFQVQLLTFTFTGYSRYFSTGTQSSAGPCFPLQVNAPVLQDHTCCFPDFTPHLPLEAWFEHRSQADLQSRMSSDSISIPQQYKRRRKQCQGDECKH